jgi:hypothetical protein
LCVGLEVGFVYVLHPALAPTPLISLTGRHSFAPESKAYPTHSGSAMHLASMHARSQDSIPIVPSASAPAHRAELPVTEPCWPLVAHSLLDASGRG